MLRKGWQRIARGRARHRWLAHCADPLACERLPPGGELSPQEALVLVQEADAHAVLPALVRNFPPFMAGADYDAARDDAVARRRMIFGQAVMLRLHADDLSAATREMPVTVIKGIAFARCIYPDPVLRSFTDIDLLVAPKVVPQVNALLVARGFELAELDEQAERLEAKWVLSSNHGILVEVHTNMVHHPGLRRSMSLTFDDLAPSLGRPAAHLTIAVVHGALHQYERLQQVMDVCQAARALRTSEDERDFEQLVGRAGCRLSAVTGLELAHRLFGEHKCLEIARGLGPEPYQKHSRALISPRVVLSTKSTERPLYSWRRKAFRALLKRNRNSRALPTRGMVAS